jgi:hypothetical protein
VKTEKPLLTKIDIEHVWAKKHKHAILDGLELCHFLGESKFNLFCSNGWKYC